MATTSQNQVARAEAPMRETQATLPKVHDPRSRELRDQDRCGANAGDPLLQFPKHSEECRTTFYIEFYSRDRLPEVQAQS